MAILRLFNGYSTAILRLFYGYFTAILRLFLKKNITAILRLLYGYFTAIIRLFYGYYFSDLIPYGFHMESIWFDLKIFILHWIFKSLAKEISP